MDVMMSMNTEDVRHLRGLFTRPLRLEAFVALLQSSLRDRIHSELDFVVGVIELFHTIDVNGDGELDWDEFAAYMMDAGIARADVSLDVDLQSVDDNAAATSGGSTALGAKQYAPLELPPRDPKTPLNRLKSRIQQLVYAADLGAVAYFEADSDVVYMYSLHFDHSEGPRHLSTLRLHTAFQEHVVIGIAYVPNGRRLLVTSSVLAAGFLSVWSVADARNPVVVRRFEACGAMELPVWLPSLQCIAVSHVLLPRVAPERAESRHTHRHRVRQQQPKHRSTGGYFRPNAGVDQPYTRSNQILLWDLSDSKPRHQRSSEASAAGASTVQHSGDAGRTPVVVRDAMRGVTSLVVFKWASRPLLAMGREDGIVSVVDAEEARDVHDFDAHGSGVKALAYSEAADCLASAGFHSFADETTLDVLIWKRQASAMLTAPSSPTAAVSSSPSSSSSSLSMKMVAEARLRGHGAPVELLAFVDSKRQLVTADRSETFLVFSSVTRTPSSEPWECLQRFSSLDSAPIGPRAPQTLWSMLVVPQTRASDAVLISAGLKLRLYDHCQVRGPDEGLLVFFTYYCSALNVIVGATSAKLMLWRADTGALWKSFDYASFAGVDVLSTSAKRSRLSRHGDEHRLGVITAVCVDDRERKLIVGDDAGTVRVLNAVNGNVMKRLDPHSGHAAVVALAYVLHGKCVISISAASELFICDEDQPAGYYVPFGGAPPESVLLQSVRFVYKPPSTPSTSAAVGNANNAAKANRLRFSILRAVANQALDTVAVLVHGSKGESFVQLWDFELSHALGTCVLPSSVSSTGEEEDITAVTLLASSGDVVAGTSRGRVLLWPEPGRVSSAYKQVLEFPVDKSTGVDEHDVVLSVCGTILFLSTLAIEQTLVGMNNADECKEPSNNRDGSDAIASSSSQRAPSLSTKEWANIFLRSHSIDARVLGEQQAGVFVVSGDDRGFVSVWVVRRRSGDANEPPTATKETFMTHTDAPQAPDLSIASIPVPTAEQLVGRTKKRTVGNDRPTRSGKKSASQHPETVVGFDTVDALFQHAIATRSETESARAVPLTRDQQAPERMEAVLRSRWRAHDEAVASLEVASEPCVALTSSSSGKIKVWSLSGALLGVIDQRATRRAPTTHPWAFPVDMADRRRRQEHEARRYLVDKTSRAASGGGIRPGTGWKASLRCSVLQDRLSLTDHELQELTHLRDGLGTGRKAHHRPLQLRQSDVGRAVRNFVLRQAAPMSIPPIPRGPKPRPQSNGRGDAADASEDDESLQTVLKEVEQFELANDAKASMPAMGTTTADKNRRETRWPIVTLANVRALAFSSRPATSGSRVHCEFPSLSSSRKTAPARNPTTTQRQRRYAAATDDVGRRRELFVSSIDRESNQSEQLEPDAASRERQAVQSRDREGDKVQRYHIKLAPSWSSAPPR